MPKSKQKPDSMANIFNALLPSTDLDEQAMMSSPHANLRKQALAVAIANSEIQFQQTHAMIKQAMQEQAEQEHILLQYRKETTAPKLQNVLSPVILAELDRISKVFDGIKSNLNGFSKELTVLRNELEFIRNTRPEVFEHLARVNAPRAEKNAALLSTILDTALPELIPTNRKKITDEFRRVEESAVTVVMAEARYRRSLKQAGMDDVRDTLSKDAANVPPELAKEQKATAIAARNVMMQEFSMRFLLAQLLTDTLKIPLVTANMRAGKFVAAAMTSEEVSQRMSNALFSFQEREINEAVEDLERSTPGESFVAKLELTQRLLRKIATVEGRVQREMDKLTEVQAQLKSIGVEMHYAPEIRQQRENFSSPFGIRPAPGLTRGYSEDDKR